MAGIVCTGPCILSSIIPVILEYPPAALTSSSTTLSGQPYGNGTYTVTQGTQFNSSFAGWYVFDKTTNNAGTSRWATNGGYNSSGNYTGAISTTVGGTGYLGDYIQITLPAGIVISSYSITNYYNNVSLVIGNTPISWILAGTNDSVPSGTGNWTLIDSRTNITWTPTNAFSTQTYTISPLSSSFKTYRIVVTKMGNYLDANLTFQEMRLFGS